MEDIQIQKREIRRQALERRKKLSEKKWAENSATILERLFSFANFLEAKVVLFYVATNREVATEQMIRKSLAYQKVVAVPWTDTEKRQIVPFRIIDFDRDLSPGYKGIPEPNRSKTKQLSVEEIDLAIIPGIAFDTRGGRIGQGAGYYDRLIPTLNITTRKVALAFECQMVPQVPMEPSDKYVDIIITEERIIYKI
jgi:5-formyltetrahydrofolate cyclo-ligase